MIPAAESICEAKAETSIVWLMVERVVEPPAKKFWPLSGGPGEVSSGPPKAGPYAHGEGSPVIVQPGIVPAPVQLLFVGLLASALPFWTRFTFSAADPPPPPPPPAEVSVNGCENIGVELLF